MNTRQRLIVFTVAVLARLLFSYGLEGVRVWSDVDSGGELGLIAVNLADGRGFSDPFGNTGQPTAWFSPAVPMLWAGLFRMTDAWSTSSLHVLMVLQSLLGGFVVLGFALLLESMNVRRSFLCGLMFALWPESLKLYAFPWYFVFQDLGMLSMIFLGLYWLRSRCWTSVILLGLVAGGTMLVNPIPLLLFGWILFGGLCMNRSFVTVQQCACSVLLAILFLSPWAVRNFKTLDKVQPFRGNFGIELRQGNDERGTLVQAAASRHPALDHAELTHYRNIGEVAYEHEAKEEALAYILENPMLTVQRTLTRVYLFWCTDILDQFPWEERTPWWQQGGVAMLQRLVLTLAAVGTVLAGIVALLTGRLHRVKDAWLWAGIVVLVPAPYYLTHVVALYPLAFKPYLLLWVLAAWLGSRADPSVPESPGSPE